MEAAGKAASLHELALDLAGVNRFDVAIQKLEQALELEPDNTAARRDLARLIAMRGNGGESRPALRTSTRAAASLRTGPLHAAGVRIARTVRAAGRLERAEVELRFAADRHPENPDAQCALAAHLVGTGHYSEALRRFQSALARDPECLKGDPEWQAAHAALTRRSGAL